jgi:hypothetical protein
MLNQSPSQQSLFAPPPPEPLPSSTVYNLDTGQEFTYSLPPEEALVACYAQSVRRDFHTWDYRTRYAGLEIRRSKTLLAVGALSVRAA